VAATATAAAAAAAAGGSVGSVWCRQGWSGQASRKIDSAAATTRDEKQQGEKKRKTKKEEAEGCRGEVGREDYVHKLHPTARPKVGRARVRMMDAGLLRCRKGNSNTRNAEYTETGCRRVCSKKTLGFIP